MQVNIKEFISKASFGKVKLGMTQEEVLEEAGEPAFFGRGDNLVCAQVWVNGITTFWFNEGRLERIGLYFILDYDSNENIGYEGYIPSGETSEQEILSFLEEQSISYTKTTDKLGKLNINIKTEVGVAMSFSHNSLNSIIYPEVA